MRADGITESVNGFNVEIMLVGSFEQRMWRFLNFELDKDYTAFCPPLNRAWQTSWVDLRDRTCRDGFDRLVAIFKLITEMFHRSLNKREVDQR
jgi:hypothetical protein